MLNNVHVQCWSCWILLQCWHDEVHDIHGNMTPYKTSILQLALHLIFITMSETKRPTNIVLLTESEHFVHISPLLKPAELPHFQVKLSVARHVKHISMMHQCLQLG